MFSERLQVLAGAVGENAFHSWTFQCVRRFSLVRDLNYVKCDHLFSSLTEPGLVSSPELVGGATRFLFLTYFMLLEASPFSAEGSRVGAKQRGNLKASFEARWALKVCRADEVTLPGTSNEGLR